MRAEDTFLHFVLKVVSRCNLNCSYCYVYNKADQSWAQQPRIMSDTVMQAALERIRAHCVKSGQETVHLCFHGGEPCLAGPARMAKWCAAARSALGEIAQVKLTMQTNGTRIDSRWIELIKEHDIEVGVSIDGPEELHDRFRVDHRGNGSYKAVEQGIARLREADVPLHLLCVMPIGGDSLAIHRHFVSLGAAGINYILPDFTHDTIGPVLEEHGPTPCADFLIPIFEEWRGAGGKGPKVSVLWDVVRLVLGGDSRDDALGNKPFHFVFVATDGGIEGLDVLKVCTDGLAGTGMNVLTHDFSEIARASELHQASIFEGVPPPSGCRGCPEEFTCSGGYLPHRYSTSRGFDNPSVWCRDLLKLFTHVRAALHVTVDETRARRQLIQAVGRPTDTFAAPDEERPEAPSLEGTTLIETMPTVLTWSGDDGVMGRVYERYTTLVNDAFSRTLGRIKSRDAALGVFLDDQIAQLPGSLLNQMLLAPETSARLLRRRPEFTEDDVARHLRRSILAEAARAGRAQPVSDTCWTALGDGRLLPSGEFLPGRAVEDFVALDFESPYATSIDLSGAHDRASRSRCPLGPAEQQLVLDRLSRTRDLITATGVEIAGFVSKFTMVLVLQADDQGFFSSGSNGDYVGRSVIGHPHRDRIDEIHLSEAVVHEAIHSLLYMQECVRPWVLSPSLYEAVPRVLSPWTGRPLPVRPFLQACFVWYGLLHFWCRVLVAGHAQPDRVQERITEALGGFLAGSLLDRVSDYTEHISADVRRAIEQMQRAVTDSFDSVAR